MEPSQCSSCPTFGHSEASHKKSLKMCTYGSLWYIWILVLWATLASGQGSRNRTSFRQTLRASGEASKSSPLQFGSTTPGFMNGIQVVKNELWHQATQFLKSKNSTTPFIVAMVVIIFIIFIFIIFIIFCLCWMCTHGHPQEEAAPEPEVELAVEEPAMAGSTAVVGLDPTVINLFPLLPFMSDGPVGFGGSECQICLEQFVHGENVRVLSTCRHIFHDLCIKAWLTSRTECAVCRHEYLGWEPEMLPTDVP